MTKEFLLKTAKQESNWQYNYIDKGLSSVEIDKLICLVHNEAPCIEPLLNIIEKEYSSSSIHRTCPKKFKRFIECISCNSPVCALTPPTDKALKLVNGLLEYKEDIKANPEVIYYYHTCSFVCYYIFILYNRF